MSDTLSALIAFIGFLIVFSMLVQSVQEALKNLFKLKTGVWERFFVTLYNKEFLLEQTPDIKLKSFWRRIKEGRLIGDFDKRLGRLSEIITKADMIIKAFKKTLYDVKNIDPAIPDVDKQVFLKIQELTDAVREITGLKLDSLLEIYDRYNKSRIKNFYNELEAFEKSLYQTNAFDVSRLSKFQEKCSNLLSSIIEIERKISDYRLQIETKMDSWLAQVNEEYRRNMLKWTVITGFAFVIGFNADSFNIFKYLLVDSKTQASLVQKTVEITAKTQHMAADDLNKIETYIIEGKVEGAKVAVIDLSAKLQEDFKGYKDIDKAEEARKVGERIKEVNSAEIDKTQELLKKEAGELSRLYVELQKRSIDYQLENLAELPLGWTVADMEAFRTTEGVIKKLCGLTLTAFLITFGAPFWNDLLSALVGIKNMTLKK